MPVHHRHDRIIILLIIAAIILLMLPFMYWQPIFQRLPGLHLTTPSYQESKIIPTKSVPDLPESYILIVKKSSMSAPELQQQGWPAFQSDNQIMIGPYLDKAVAEEAEKNLSQKFTIQVKMENYEFTTID